MILKAGCAVGILRAPWSRLPVTQSAVLELARQLIEQREVPNLLAALSVLAEREPAARPVTEKLLRQGPRQLREHYPWGFPIRRR